MGGSDPLELTDRAARALAPLEGNFRIRFVIGSGIKEARKVAAGIVAMKSNYETVEGADDLSTEYAAADLALCAFGVTAYELAAFGVPAIYLGSPTIMPVRPPPSAPPAWGRSLGVAAQVTDEEILGAVRALMNNPARRREMRAMGLATLDGGGAARIAADLAPGVARRKTAGQSCAIIPRAFAKAFAQSPRLCGMTNWQLGAKGSKLCPNPVQLVS